MPIPRFAAACVEAGIQFGVGIIRPLLQKLQILILKTLSLR